jgi:hypothetical protein
MLQRLLEVDFTCQSCGARSSITAALPRRTIVNCPVCRTDLGTWGEVSRHERQTLLFQDRLERKLALLARAERHLIEARQRIAEQRERVINNYRTNRLQRSAALLLRTLEETYLIWVDHRDALIREIERMRRSRSSAPPLPPVANDGSA